MDCTAAHTANRVHCTVRVCGDKERGVQWCTSGRRKRHRKNRGTVRSSPATGKPTLSTVRPAVLYHVRRFSRAGQNLPFDRLNFDDFNGKSTTKTFFLHFKKSVFEDLVQSLRSFVEPWANLATMKHGPRPDPAVQNPSSGSRAKTEERGRRIVAGVPRRSTGFQLRGT